MKTLFPLTVLAFALFTSGLLPSSHAAETEKQDADWTNQQVERLPASEAPQSLFNGKDLTGWNGREGRWSVEEGAIVGRNEDRVPRSTYLFTEKKYRNFRLLLETKQTRSPKHSTMHSAICCLGQQFEDKGGNKFGFKGPS